MATLQEQVSSRAAQAPQQKIRSVDPTALLQSGIRAHHDYRLAHLNKQYEDDRMRTKAHMEHAMAKERGRLGLKREQKMERLRNRNEQERIDRSSQRSLNEKGFFGDLPTATAHAGQAASRDRTAMSLAAANAQRMISTPFDPTPIYADHAQRVPLPTDPREMPDDVMSWRMNQVYSDPARQAALTNDITQAQTFHAQQTAGAQRTLQTLLQQGAVPYYPNPIAPQGQGQGQAQGQTQGESDDDFIEGETSMAPPDSTPSDSAEGGRFYNNPLYQGAQAAAIGIPAYRGMINSKAQIAGRDMFGQFGNSSPEMGRYMSARQAKADELKRLRDAGRNPSKFDTYKNPTTTTVRNEFNAAKSAVASELADLSPEDKIRLGKQYGAAQPKLVDFAEELMKKNKLLEGTEGKKLTDAIKQARTAATAAERNKAAAIVFKHLDDAYASGLIKKGSARAIKKAAEAGLKKSILASTLRTIAPRAAALVGGPVGWAITALSFAPIVWDLFKGDDKD